MATNFWSAPGYAGPGGKPAPAPAPAGPDWGPLAPLAGLLQMFGLGAPPAPTGPQPPPGVKIFGVGSGYTPNVQQPKAAQNPWQGPEGLTAFAQFLKALGGITGQGSDGGQPGGAFGGGGVLGAPVAAPTPQGQGPIPPQMQAPAQVAPIPPATPAPAPMGPFSGMGGGQQNSLMSRAPMRGLLAPPARTTQPVTRPSGTY